MCVIRKMTGLLGWILVFAVACQDGAANPAEKDTATDAAVYDGVDILVVVDTSSKMTAAQYQLSTAVYTLVNRLTRPATDAGEDSIMPASVRFGVVSTDMGYQYGEGAPAAVEISGCSPYGDDGVLLQPSVLNIAMADDVIECEVDGGQCPREFDCVAGRCRAPGGVTTVACPATAGAWIETETEGVGSAPDSASQVACGMQQGIAGCSIAQPLKAIQKAMARNPAFPAASHLSAVLVVTDDDDCSMDKPSFLVNPDDTASPVVSSGLSDLCAARPDLLYSTTVYVNELVTLKNGDAGGVVFAAVAGVPTGTDSPCRGNGLRVLKQGCLEAAEMQAPTEPLFAPVCTRTDDDGGAVLVEAKPGRRLVETVQQFGKNGYVYSICEADWRPAMTAFADAILSHMTR